MAILKGKNVFVTGGGSGIGLACASAFASDGANVLIMGREQDKLLAAVDELSSFPDAGDIRFFVGDVCIETNVSDAFEEVAIGG